MSKNYRVVTDRDGWAVKRDGEVMRRFDAKIVAVEFAREKASRDEARLTIHRRDGTFQLHHSYTNGKTWPDWLMYGESAAVAS